MILSSNAKEINDYFTQEISSKLGIVISNSEGFRTEKYYRGVANSQVMLTVGHSDGVLELSVHERSEEQSLNLLYVTIVLDEPVNSAIVTVTSDSEDDMNCEITYSDSDVLNGIYRSTISSYIQLAEKLLFSLELVK